MTRSQRSNELRLCGAAAAKASAYFLFARAHLMLARATALQAGQHDMRRHVWRNVQDAKNYRRLAKEQRQVARARFCRGLT